MTTQPERHTVDTITSDALDQLYARIVDLEQQLAFERDEHRQAHEIETENAAREIDRALVAEARVRELGAEVARLTAGQCTHALAVCEQHHRVPVAGCPYPRCKAATARTT
ncbi:hypothetical protein [[Kitasatospora] papulosa]|uniref:hypothetical protein n=1 Tax=[Kitasatospora] papulosa TaxID=1464011 RepID=UPI003687CFB8